MPDLNAWPPDSEVIATLTSAGAWDSAAQVDVAAQIAAAVEDLEDETGYKPFLNHGLAESTRSFDPPGPIRQPHATLMGGGKNLFLGTGLISITSLSIGDDVLAVGVQYFAARFDHGSPITMIRFPGGIMTRPQGIEITGVYGYCSILPLKAYNAVKARAAAKALPLLAAWRRTQAEDSQAGTIKAKETGPVRTEYAVSSAEKTTEFSSLKSELETEWRNAVRQFKLVE